MAQQSLFAPVEEPEVEDDEPSPEPDVPTPAYLRRLETAAEWEARMKSGEIVTAGGFTGPVVGVGHGRFEDTHHVQVLILEGKKNLVTVWTDDEREDV